MIIAVLVVLGLCLGSFVNALVWRVHEQEKNHSKKVKNLNSSKKLSIFSGRSMCPNCKHELKAIDLVPILSWLSLKGKCRYCHKLISAQYPLVELATSIMFVVSYTWWPVEFDSSQVLLFGLWLTLLTGFMALIVYDLRWLLLPNRIVYPLGFVALAFSLIEIAIATNPAIALLNTVLAVLIGGGIFYLLFQISKGKWIGGGDVRLGWLLGLIAGTPSRSVLFIFIAALLGSIVSLSLILLKKVKLKSMVPFGPFLILGLIIVQLFGTNIIDWYQSTFINL